MTLDLLGQLLQHINLPLPPLALLEPLHDLLGPFAALAARGALPAAFVLVERREARDGSHDVGGFVHYDDGRGAETGLAVLESVEVHELLVADAAGEDGSGGAAGDDGFEVVPSASDAAAVLLDEFAEGDRHFFLNGAGVVDVAGDAEELGARVSLPAKGIEPACTAADDGGGYRDGFDVGHC